MKTTKLALLTITLLLSSIGNAQPFISRGEMIRKDNMENMPNQKMERAKDRQRIGPKRTVDNGLYYTIPDALYGGWTVDGMGYKYSMALVPPFTDVTFANQNKDKSACSWFINGNDATENAAEKGDYVSNYSPNGWFYSPVLQNRKIAGGYQFNEDNYWVGCKESCFTFDMILTFQKTLIY